MATVEEVMALMGAILAIITHHVSDERIRRAIGFDIEALVSGVELNRKVKPSLEGEIGDERRDKDV